MKSWINCEISLHTTLQTNKQKNEYPVYSPETEIQWYILNGKKGQNSYVTFALRKWKNKIKNMY